MTSKRKRINLPDIELKALLASAPLDGIDLRRSRDTGREDKNLQTAVAALRTMPKPKRVEKRDPIVLPKRKRD